MAAQDTVRDTFGISSNVQPAPGTFIAGVELEIEDTLGVAGGLPGGWHSEEDGSLRNYGMEFISPPLAADSLIAHFQHIHAKLSTKTGKQEHFSDRTSIHVHVNCLDLTQEQVAERMGKDRSTIANFIRLLKLPPDIQVAVRIGEISMGHARALINVDSIDKQLFVFDQIKEKGLSVRQTEALVRNLYKDSGVVKKHTKSSLPDGFQRIEDKLASHFSTRVKMKHSKDNSGSITFEYYSMDELNKILGQLDVPLD